MRIYSDMGTQIQNLKEKFDVKFSGAEYGM